MTPPPRYQARSRSVVRRRRHRVRPYFIFARDGEEFIGEATSTTAAGRVFTDDALIREFEEPTPGARQGNLCLPSGRPPTRNQIPKIERTRLWSVPRRQRAALSVDSVHSGASELEKALALEKVLGLPSGSELASETALALEKGLASETDWR